jgi:hypothetical protein
MIAYFPTLVAFIEQNHNSNKKTPIEMEICDGHRFESWKRYHERCFQSAVAYGTAGRQICELRTLQISGKYIFPDGIKCKGAHTVSSARHQPTTLITSSTIKYPSSKK